MVAFSSPVLVAESIRQAVYSLTNLLALQVYN
jgi:hypothetical protein